MIMMQPSQTMTGAGRSTGHRWAIHSFVTLTSWVAGPTVLQLDKGLHSALSWRKEKTSRSPSVMQVGEADLPRANYNDMFQAFVTVFQVCLRGRWGGRGWQLPLCLC